MIVYDVALEWLDKGQCPIIVVPRRTDGVAYAVTGFSFEVDESVFEDGIPTWLLVEKTIECYDRAAVMNDDDD